jgi:hypothetical protein
MAKRPPSGNGTPVNKSQAIREFLAENPKADTKSVVAGLAEKGMRVAPTLVYFIKSKQNQARRRVKRDRLAETSRQTAAADPVGVVIRVKDLAREVGGIKNLKRLVDVLAD